ncbi:hypothetical protein B0H19DRAFT_1079484 [Mycena capillaripes]|nr:hypothetical protein B0H19DRAFT_1079484 [Mycena capillaripes]
MTFIQRFEFGAEQSYSRVLAWGNYKEQFDSIRARSRTMGETTPVPKHLFSFVDTEAAPVREPLKWGTAACRKRRAQTYVARLFGRVQSVLEVFDDVRAIMEHGIPTLIFCLECPASDDESVTDLFRSEEDVLNRIIEVDQELIIWCPCDRFMTHSLSRDMRGEDVQVNVRLERFQGDEDENGETAKGMMDQDGELERHSYKDIHLTNQSRLYHRNYRRTTQRYRGHFIGQIHSRRVEYDDNPLYTEGFGSDCWILTFNCPVGADDDTVELFHQQVAKLKEIIEKDLIQSPGIVAGGWLKKDADGSTMIEAITAGRDVGLNLELTEGRDVEMAVHLCKDEHIVSQFLLPRAILKCNKGVQTVADILPAHALTFSLTQEVGGREKSDIMLQMKSSMP